MGKTKTNMTQLPGILEGEKKNLPLDFPPRDYGEKRQSVLITYNGRITEVFLGLDGTAWVWDGNRQKVVASAKDAREFLVTRAINTSERDKAERITCVIDGDFKVSSIHTVPSQLTNRVRLKQEQQRRQQPSFAGDAAGEFE